MRALIGQKGNKMKKLLWKIKIFFLALCWNPHTNLGDVVKYKGKKYTVFNGVRPYSWQLDKLDNNYDGWVPRKDCIKVMSVSNIRHSFFSGWNFYMTSWYDIWCREGIKNWMRGCNIWPRPFNSLSRKGR
jgi:hypothetical protein